MINSTIVAGFPLGTVARANRTIDVRLIFLVFTGAATGAWVSKASSCSRIARIIPSSVSVVYIRRAKYAFIGGKYPCNCQAQTHRYHDMLCSSSQV